MILSAAAFIVVLGLGVWVLGHYFSYTGVAVIGAVLVLGVGAMVTLGGVEYAAGETVDTSTTETEVAVDDIGEAVHVQTKDVSAQDNSPTGVDFNRDGDQMFLSGASNANIYAYDSGDHDLSIATFAASFSVSGEDTTPVGVEFRPDGSRMYVVGDSTDRIYQYDLGTAYDITTASVVGNFSVSGEASSPRSMDFNDDGTTMYVAGAGSGTIYSYDLSTPYDITTATQANQFDVSSQESTPTAFDFSADGTRLVLVGEGQNVIFEYALNTPYDLTTAEYSGNMLDISGEVQQASGIAYEDAGRKTFVSDRQGSTVEQYDSAQTQSNTVTTKETTYDDLNFPQEFSLGALLVLLGTSLMSQTLQERAT